MATNCDEGALRAAATALRASGGFQVDLRLPGEAVSGNPAEELGLTAPQFQDVPLGLAVWRKVGNTAGLLLDAASVSSLLGSGAYGSAEVLFQTSVGVVVGGVLYAITKSEPLTVAGLPCAYRLSVQEPAWV
ncbi:MAG TPA: hypothetical protein VKV02_08675 [Acidobacteriaceae bacterium]|nr:hypothetical protein [Acidobacteriaceae bacterium]